jgi:hypothetical protein
MQGTPVPPLPAGDRRLPLLALTASLVLGATVAWHGPAAAQQPQPSAGPQAQAPAAPRPQGGRPVSRAVDTKPAWTELTADQQQALKPLAAQWPTLSEPQKRKWIAMSGNYRALPPAEQDKLHSRMTEWVALSPQQRTQARLNFGEAKGLSPDDKKAKWEAYQALSPEEKHKLAAGAGGKTPPTAAAVRPVPAQKLANVPRGSADTKAPRIVAGPLAEAHPPHQPAQHGAPGPQAN